MDKNLLNKIQKHAIHLDWDIAFAGKSKGNKHLFRVNKLAKQLLDKEGGNEFIILAAAWLHDSDLIVSKDHHLAAKKLVCEDFLGSLGLSPIKIKKIVHCIRSHDGIIEAESKEAQIVHDADTLDKGGPLGIIRHTWKLVHLNPNITLNEILAILPKHLSERKENLHTKTAKNIADKNSKILSELLKSKDFPDIIENIMDLAKQDLITEQIARQICMIFSQNMSIQKLKEQLEAKNGRII